jgi:hypothetical protein
LSAIDTIPDSHGWLRSVSGVACPRYNVIRIKGCYEGRQTTFP